MKRVLAVLLAAVMLLALCACGGDARTVELYEKYAHIIDRLEAEDYSGAIQEVAILANDGKEAEQPGSLGELLVGSWYLDDDNDKAPKTITVGRDGSVTVDGETYTWLDQREDDNYKGGFLLKDGVHTYMMELSKYSSDIVPSVSLRTVEDSDGDFHSGAHLGYYYNDPMLVCLMNSWDNLDDEDEVLEDYFSIWNSSISMNNTELDWSVTASDSSTITVDLEGTYTFVVELRGEKPIGFLTDNATGAQAAYYAPSVGYDRSWPEYLYPQAKSYLADCLDDLEADYTPSFYDYTLEESVSYSENAAWRRIYELLAGLGDYKDSAELCARFTVLKDMYVGADILRVDHIGNESSYSGYEEQEYNALGQVTYSKSEDNFRLYGSGYSYGGLYFFYDETGRMIKAQQGRGNGVSAVITPSYDDQGRMVSATYQTNSESYELSYRYDDQGRLVENTVWDGSTRYQYAYTYDSEGRLTKLVCWYGWSEPDYNNNRDTTEYTYDANGFLVEKVTVYEYYRSYDKSFDLNKTITYTYTNDAQGRPVSAEYSETNSEGTSSYASQTVTYKYEDLYFFE